jgi:flagellar biosynthesis GTPase FlhF
METDVKTYRGRTLEELLPQIREELGPDAIVLRRREGLAGGMGGFFQKHFVEVDARKALPDETPLEIRNDRATEAGLSTPGVQALVAQASPFADTLSRAQEILHEAAVEHAPAGLYGPQPFVSDAAALGRASAPTPETSSDLRSPDRVFPEPATDARPATSAFTLDSADTLDSFPSMPAVSDSAVAPAPSLAATPAPAAAAAVEKRLVDGGLTASLASDLVGEAVTHGLPFHGPRALKKLVRSALTRRLPVMADMGPDSRVVAFVGTGGSGKSNAIAHIATAYANAGASIAVIALRSPDGGRALAAKLEPIGVSVLTTDADVSAAKKRLDASSPLLTLIDTPAASPADAAGVAALASQLKALGATEVHLALPATLSAQAGEELAAAMRPLGLTHLALTRADETSRPGAVVELAIALRRPLSYRCAYDGAAPLDPGSLAQTLLP